MRHLVDDWIYGLNQWYVEDVLTLGEFEQRVDRAFHGEYPFDPAPPNAPIIELPPGPENIVRY